MKQKKMEIVLKWRLTMEQLEIKSLYNLEETIAASLFFTTTSVLSLLTFDVMEPAPMCDL